MSALKVFLIVFTVGSATALFSVVKWLNPSTSVNQSEGVPVPDSVPILTHQPVSLYRSNTWYTSGFRFPSQPIFALPGAYQWTAQGLAIGRPLPTASAHTVWGTFTQDCILQWPQPITQVNLIATSDWSATWQVITSADQISQVQLIQGQPLVSIKSNTSRLVLTCSNFSFKPLATGLIAEQSSKRLLIQAQSGTTNLSAGYEVSLFSPSGRFRLIWLPESFTQPESESQIINYPWTEVSDTKIDWQVSGQQVTTQYQWTTNNHQSVLTTLWPHHRPYITSRPPVLGTYLTHIGSLDLVSLSQFQTIHPLPPLPFTFTPVQSRDRQIQIKSAIQTDANRLLSETAPDGVYFRGTWLGSLSTLIQIADIYELIEIKNQLVDRLTTEWEVSLKAFTYQAELRMLVSRSPEFGHETGNDHHLQYGYYIRSAAVLVNYRKEEQQILSPLISDLIADIANHQRDRSEYPFLRHYSIYEGHSWADGDADFADGNNQESSSEALNAWYAIKLWGEITNNQSLVDLGNWIFSQELAGAQAYWFAENNPFPAGYEHQISSIVWGGKRDFATWFSPQPLHVYGIQWLPITPASSYLTRLAHRSAMLAELNNLDANPWAHEWGDLYAIFASGQDQDIAETRLPQITSSSGLKLKSLLYHWVYFRAQ